MPIVSGDLGLHGAVIPMLVGVSRNRRAVLERMRLRVPEPVAIRAQIDTGSFATGIMPSVFEMLGIGPIGSILVRTPSTTRATPHECPQFDVTLTFVSGFDQFEIPNTGAIRCDDFNPDEEVQAIIGRDVLSRCIFNFDGPGNCFSLAY